MVRFLIPCVYTVFLYTMYRFWLICFYNIHFIFIGQPLDTLGMSRRVRELLSIHNIGQRLFAKYVLGLSQGTVSELLSKPKSWDKLTEKGRDSYRKMHAWCYDEQAVMLLKSLIPRKGELMRPVSQAAHPPPNLGMMKGKAIYHCGERGIRFY